MLSVYAAVFFTVALLVTTAYFIMGGLPLLILDHSTPVDGHFVQRFFEIYCTAAQVSALGATLSYVLAGMHRFALGTGIVALVVVGFRRTIIPAMTELASRIPAEKTRAIRAFRQIHAAALLINLAQLVALVWGVVQLSF